MRRPNARRSRQRPARRRRTAVRGLHVLPHLLPPADRPACRAAEPPVSRIAVEAHVHVVVVRLRVARLVNDERRPFQQRRVVARCGRLAQKARPQVALHEDPLHLGVGIGQQRAHEGPVSARIEPIAGHRPGRRMRPLRRRPANGTPIGREVQHGVGQPGRPPRPVEGVVENVDVAAVLMRLGAGPTRRPNDAKDRRRPRFHRAPPVRPCAPPAPPRRPVARSRSWRAASARAAGRRIRHRRTEAPPGGGGSRRRWSPATALEKSIASGPAQPAHQPITTARDPTDHVDCSGQPSSARRGDAPSLP